MVQIDFFPSWLNALLIAIAVLLIVWEVWQWFRKQGSIWNLCSRHKSAINKILVVSIVLVPIAVFALGVHWALGVQNSYHTIIMLSYDDDRWLYGLLISLIFLFCKLIEGNDKVWEVYWYVLLAMVVVFLYILSIAWGKAVTYLILQTITVIPLYYMTKEKQTEPETDDN